MTSNNFIMVFSTDQTERYTWAVWLIFILIGSVLGNTAILVASCKHNAFRLNLLMVALIQHIAACDLLISASTIFPRMFSLFANGWFFGTPVCYLTAYLTAYGVPASSLLTCTMTTCKLWLLKCPQRAKSFSKRQAHLLCLCIWLLACCIPVLYLIVDKYDVDWNDNTYYCYYKHKSSPKWGIIKLFKHAVFGGLPTIIVIVTSVFLIKHLLEAREASKRSKGSVRWQGIATVVAVACVYTIAILPLTTFWIVESYLTDEQAKILSRKATTFFYINVASKVFIYVLTVKDFRRFLQAVTNFSLSDRALSSTGRTVKKGTTREMVIKSNKTLDNSIREIEVSTEVSSV